MKDTFNPPTTIDGIERLLSSLHGIVSARVVARWDGRLEEIHVLAEQGEQAKRIVRNVESALNAGAGIEIDRRIVSVAQVRPGLPVPPVPEPVNETPIAEPHEGSTQRRPVFVSFDTRLDSSRQTTCQVTLRWGPDEFTGRAQGPDTPQGRAEAGARATIEALSACRGGDQIGLVGVAIVDTHSPPHVLVAARAIEGRRTTPLTGAARIQDTPEEAAILATLKATNYWQGKP